MINNKNEVILIDYGLAFRFSRDSDYHEFHPNKKAKHNGTIEYTSRDTHIGCRKITFINKIILNLSKIYIHFLEPSRRGDKEIQIIHLIHWLTGG
jgi:hypothetical protein